MPFVERGAASFREKPLFRIVANQDRFFRNAVSLDVTHPDGGSES